MIPAYAAQMKAAQQLHASATHAIKQVNSLAKPRSSNHSKNTPKKEQKPQPNKAQPSVAKEVKQQDTDPQKQSLYLAELQTIYGLASDKRTQLSTTPNGTCKNRQEFNNNFVHAIEEVLMGKLSAQSAEYVLTTESRFILNNLDLDYVTFAQCTGNPVQLQKHEEIVFVANEFGSLHEQPRFQTLSRTMYGFLDGARESNNENNVRAAYEITNFCWNMLEYARELESVKYACAVGGGAIDGLLSVAHTVCHPRETIQNVSSALYNSSLFLAELVSDITLRSSIDVGYCADQFIGIESEYPIDEVNRIADKFSKISDALQDAWLDHKKTTGPQRVHSLMAFGTEFVVSGKVFGVLMQGAGSLYECGASQLKMLAQNYKKGTTFEQMIACAEGVEMKIAVQAEKATEKIGMHVGDCAKLVSGTKQFSSSIVDEAVKWILDNERKVEHIFKKIEHNLGPLVEKLGGQENFLRAVLNAADGKLPMNGVFKNVRVTVDGYEVYLRGCVIDSVPKIGTMFIK
jgi:hypothetical protein